MLDIYQVTLEVPDVSLVQATAPTSRVAKIADLASYNSMLHHTLAYFLDNTPAAEAGVYGFFAHVTSPGYQSSEPFFVALNLDISGVAEFQNAAKEINAAAGLAADYDLDGDVDGADLLLWQRSLGGVADGRRRPG